MSAPQQGEQSATGGRANRDRVFAALHLALVAIEHQEFEVQFDGLDGYDCLMANSVVQAIDDMLRDRWVFAGSPAPDPARDSCRVAVDGH
ncbi:MAG: hypothetical protein ABWY93_04725 [Mycobacterium sp.]